MFGTPLNPSANYTCGLLVHGFDLAPTIMMPWNPPYYAELLETWHLRKEQDLFAYQIERSRLTPPEWLSEEVTRLKAEARFTCRTSSKATLAVIITGRKRWRHPSVTAWVTVIPLV